MRSLVLRRAVLLSAVLLLAVGGAVRADGAGGRAPAPRPTVSFRPSGYPPTPPTRPPSRPRTGSSVAPPAGVTSPPPPQRLSDTGVPAWALVALALLLADVGFRIVVVSRPRSRRRW